MDATTATDLLSNRCVAAPRYPPQACIAGELMWRRRMKIIAYDRFKPGVGMETIEPYLKDEVANVWRLWKAGIVRENYARAGAWKRRSATSRIFPCQRRACWSGTISLYPPPRCRSSLYSIHKSMSVNRGIAQLYDRKVNK